MQRATTSLDIGGLSLDGFREQCMSILRDGVNSARLAGASAFYADLSWMWTVVNRISCELLERRIQCKVENEMRPLLSLIARLEQKVRHSRFLAACAAPQSLHDWLLNTTLLSLF